jgi:phage shock protein B
MCDVTTILLGLIVVFGPCWLLFSFLNRLVGNRGLSKRDSAALEQIATIAARMESRMETVERILDVETPAWRQNVPGRYRQAG